VLNSDYKEIVELLQTMAVEFLAQHSAILEVIASIVILWSLGKLLGSRKQRLAANQTTPSTSATQEESDTFPLSQSLHVDGLSASLLQELNILIKRKDMLRLAIFFAIHQPSIREIEFLFKSIQGKQSAEHDHIMLNFLVATKNISIDLQSETLRKLTQNDITSILTHYQKKQKLIDKNFITKFGNLLFMENFFMYKHLCRTSPAIFNIPDSSELRRMFESFVKTGLAVQGLSITLENRLHLLDLKKLQAMANDLNLNIIFNTVNEATTTLANDPMTVGYLADKYPDNDLFLLKQENWDCHAVEQEWSAYNAYAKLLCTAPM